MKANFGVPVAGLPQPPNRRPAVRPRQLVGPKLPGGRFYVKGPRAKRPRTITPKAAKEVSFGYRRRRSSAWGLLKKIIRILRKSKRTSDFRNHGFKNSGFKGRTGFAGMRPRRAW